MKTNVVVAIIAAVIVVIAGAAAIVLANGNGGGNEPSPDPGPTPGPEPTPEPETYTFTDGKGRSITLEVPISCFATTNQYAAEYAQIFGIADMVTGLDHSNIGTVKLSAVYGGVTDIGTITTPSAEKISESGASIVISPVTARAITNAEALEAQGITVIYLDLYDSTLESDLQIFHKLIGSSIDAAMDSYIEYRDGITAKALESIEALGIDTEYDFLIPFLGRGANFYNNHTSAQSMIIEECDAHVKNITRLFVDSPKKSSEQYGSDVILSYGDSIDYIVIRASDGTTSAQAWDSFLAWNADFAEIRAVDAGGAYAMHTDICTGTESYISYVCYAIMLGADIDLDPLDLANEFCTKFGFVSADADPIYTWIFDQVGKV